MIAMPLLTPLSASSERNSVSLCSFIIRDFSRLLANERQVEDMTAGPTLGVVNLVNRPHPGSSFLELFGVLIVVLPRMHFY